jgi:hypothetical protein
MPYFQSFILIGIAIFAARASFPVDLPPLYYTTIEVEALNVKYIILIKK